jgi:hypothetical protein
MISGVSALLIAVVTVSSPAVKTALADPVARVKGSDFYSYFRIRKNKNF